MPVELAVRLPNFSQGYFGNVLLWEQKHEFTWASGGVMIIQGDGDTFGWPEIS